VVINSDLTITRTTDGSATSGDPNSDPAAKLYADAQISISPPYAENFTGVPHELTVLVEEDTGSGFVAAGFVAAAGENVLLEITSGDALFTVDDGIDQNGDGNTANDIVVTTDANGMATADINSDTVGLNTITASSYVVINDDLSIYRETDGEATPSGGQNSYPAEKLYISGGGQITPTGTDCHDYITGTAIDFEDYYDFQNGDIQYGDSNKAPGIINNTNPGVFFYYTGLGNFIQDDGTGEFTVFVDQENHLVAGSTVEDFALFGINRDGVKLYQVDDLNGNGMIDADDDCQQVQLITDPKGNQVANAEITVDDGDVTLTYLDADPDALYVVGIKYETDDMLIGTRFANEGFDPDDAPIYNYTFVTYYEGAKSETDDQGGVNLSYKFDPSPSVLMLDGEPLEDGHAPNLNEGTLKHVLEWAMDYWSDQGEDVSDLSVNDVLITDLGDKILSQTEGNDLDGYTMSIDDDAAGYGWSVGLGSVAPKKVDLLSAVVHELGHMLGYDHDVMDPDLAVGERDLPQVAEVSDVEIGLVGTAPDIPVEVLAA